MNTLSFTVTGAEAQAHAAVPILNFRLRLREISGQAVQGLLLRCLVQIEPRRRKHTAEEQERLGDLFGEPARWSETLRPLLWTQASLAIPGFQDSLETDLPVACTYDFEVASAKYLQALAGGEVPLLFLFSGTVFVKGENGFRVEPIPWDKQAVFRMPVEVWRRLMDAYFPESGWIRLHRETLERLQRFRAQRGLVSWEETIEALMGAREAAAR